MNFFGSRRSPPPCVSFFLDPHCQETFQPGSRISGTVRFTAQARCNIEYAELQFAGHSITHSHRQQRNGPNGQNRRTIHYHDDALLFRYSQYLTKDMFLDEGMNNDWRFEFAFPYDTGLVETNPFYTSSWASIFTTSTHTLPPSFAHALSSIHYATVEYNLQAVFQLEGEKEPHIIQLPDPLKLLPHSQGPHQPRLVEFVKPSQPYSTSRLVGAEKSFGGSIKDKFSSGTPTVNVTLKASVPTLLDTAAAFPIYVCAEIDSPSVDTVAIPAVIISITKLQLCQFTFFRAIRQSRWGTAFADSERVSHDENLVYLNAVPEHSTVEQKHGSNGDRKFWYYPASFETRVPGGTCPTFQTFNINHNFRTELTVSAEICGKKFEFKIDVPDVVILPPS
jgi:hypothetical protein